MDTNDSLSNSYGWQYYMLYTIKVVHDIVLNFHNPIFLAHFLYVSVCLTYIFILLWLILQNLL